MGILTTSRNHDVVSTIAEQSAFYQAKATGTGATNPVIRCVRDRYHCYLPGDTVHARIELDKERLKGLVNVQVEFRGMIHSWGTRQSGNNTVTYIVDKQPLFAHSCSINPVSLEVQSSSPYIQITPAKDSAWIFDVNAQLPTMVRYREKDGQFLPPSFIFIHRAYSEQSTAMVSYHFKITGKNEKTFSRDERTWTPVAVLPFCRSWDPALELPLHYGNVPSHWIRQYDVSDYQRRLVIKKGVVEVEVVHPILQDLPMHIEMPFILRISVRAKSLSDLLSGAAIELPTLPLASVETKDEEERKPSLSIVRHLYTKAERTRAHNLKDYQECFVRWYPHSSSTGFTQQADEKGGEGGSAEGTPVADDRAKRGLDHGWTWPAHDPEGKHYSTPHAPRFGSQGASSKHAGQRFEKDIKTCPYVTTATVYGKVLLSSAASVPFEVYHLSTHNRLEFKWDFNGARNKVEMDLGFVVMTSGVTSDVRWRLSPQEVERRLMGGHYGKQGKTKTIDPSHEMREEDTPPNYKKAAGDQPPSASFAQASGPAQEELDQGLPGYQSATVGMTKLSVSDDKGRLTK